MKYIKYGAVALAIIIAISAFLLKPVCYTKSDFLLDTYISVTVYGFGSEKAADKAISRVRELENLLSAFRPESDVSKINSAGKDKPVRVSEECFYVIGQALELSQKTKGAFDITIKPVMELWGFGGEQMQVPKTEEILETLPLVDAKYVELDPEMCTVTLKKEGMKIDLGGVAKGYCADEAAKILIDEGVKNAYLNFGGNVVTIGSRPLGFSERLRHGVSAKPFSVGIQDPSAQQGTIFETYIAKTPNDSVVTSGGYERFFEQDGKKYHHILDPKTGKQPENGILSVTVMGKSSLVCDALSTALFVSGPDGIDMAKGLCSEVLFVTDSGDVIKMNP